jgi:thiopeptide-type bacteriocin biosynthesis protein
VVERDNVLPFNLDSNWMVGRLVKLLSKASRAELRDLYPLGLKPAVTGHRGAHHAEVLVPLKLRSSPNNPRIQCPLSLTAGTVMPIWSEWMYLNIYCHPERQNAVLIELDQSIIELQRTKMVSQFMFLRYSDENGAHIRLRLKALHGQAGVSLLGGLSQTLQTLKERGSITNVTHMPYVREVTRYGGEELCGYCEEIFSIDSSACMLILKSWNQQSSSAWHVPVAAIDSMLEALGLKTLREKFDFSDRAAADFSKEFGFDSADRKNIGLVFRNADVVFDSDTVITKDPVIDDILRCSSRSVSDIWGRILVRGYLTEEKTYRMRWSIVHMRANRLFDKESRIQEAVSWDLLRRTYFGILARDKRASKQVN